MTESNIKWWDFKFVLKDGDKILNKIFTFATDDVDEAKRIARHTYFTRFNINYEIEGVLRLGRNHNV
mgnify:CR=1 FL=1|jgi:hypothetical protein|tara:strand:+ start:1031 stop:1231 length:201 start_codon:yes stop_codon:yes gene_type:complete